MSSYLPTTDELTYQTLLQEMQDMNAIISKFINGSADTSIAVSSGTIKTLAGIQKAALTPSYIQTIVDIENRAYVLNHMSYYTNGQLFRIWGETDPLFNGIYKKDTDTTIVKVSYADLYDLKEYFPDPWDYSQISFDESTSIANQFLIATVTQPVQAVKFNLDAFTLDYTYIVDSNSQYASYHVVDNITVRLSARAQSEHFESINNSGTGVTTNFYSTLVYSQTPQITVEHTSDVTNHIFNIYFVPPRDASNVIVSGHGIIRFKNVDKTYVKIQQHIV